MEIMGPKRLILLRHWSVLLLLALGHHILAEHLLQGLLKVMLRPSSPGVAGLIFESAAVWWRLRIIA
jgi:hypothetical protein